MSIKKPQKAQTTFEYIVFVSAVIVVLIVFLSPAGIFRNKTESIMNRTVNEMLNSMVNVINYEGTW